MSKPRKLTATTIPLKASAARAAGLTTERDRVVRVTRERKNDDPVFNEVHAALVGKKDDKGDKKRGDAAVQEVVAVVSHADKNVFVEKIALLGKLDATPALIALPAPALSAERALHAGRMLNIEAAGGAILHCGAELDGLYVTIVESGDRTLDQEVYRELETLGEEGFELDPDRANVMRDIEDHAMAMVRGRHSWRPDIRVAYAPPEKVFDLAREKLMVERWVAELEEAYKGDPDAFVRHVGAAIERLSHTAGGKAARLCNYLFEEIARRVKSVSAGFSGAEISVELREPANDNGSSRGKREA